MRTPWGDMDRLRERRPRAGPGERGEVRRNQRERLFAAMVVCCEEKGYEATSVADLLQASGISRSTFYGTFDDKRDCFCTAEREMIKMSVAALRERLAGEGDAEERARAAFEVFVDLLIAQPAAARMGMVESYAAGEAAAETIRTSFEGVVQLARDAQERMPERSGMPAELTWAIIAGFYQVIYTRLQSHRESELTELVPSMWDWAMSFRPPVAPLRSGGRRPAAGSIATLPPFAAFSPEQRIIRAFASVVAEKGYPATTVADVSAAAGISQTTFYLHFADKADLLMAALDSSGAQMLAASMPPARRAPDWPSAVRAAVEASCGFLASEPAFARLRMVELYSAGPEAIAMRERTGKELIGTLLGPAFDDAPIVPNLLVELTIGGIFGLFYDRIRAGRIADLPGLAPLLTYFVVCPVLGPERASEVANGKRTTPAG